MPGMKGRDEKTVLIQVRVTPDEAARWRAHVPRERGYLSVMVRDCVNAHVAVEGPSPKCRHWS